MRLEHQSPSVTQVCPVAKTDSAENLGKIIEPYHPFSENDGHEQHNQLMRSWNVRSLMGKVWCHYVPSTFGCLLRDGWGPPCHVESRWSHSTHSTKVPGAFQETRVTHSHAIIRNDMQLGLS